MQERPKDIPLQEQLATREYVFGRLRGMIVVMPFGLGHVDEPPEDQIAERLLNPSSPESRALIINEMSIRFKEITSSVLGKSFYQTNIDEGILQRFARVIDLSKPEELRPLVVGTFRRSLENSEEIHDVGLAYLAQAALAYARKDNPEDLELWKKAHQRPILKGVCIQALLAIDAGNPTITDDLKEALTSNPKNWAVRFVVRDIVKARSLADVSRIIREYIGDEATLMRLKEMFASDPDLSKLLEDATKA